MTDYMNIYRKRQKVSKHRDARVPLPGDIWWVNNLDGIKDRPILVVKTDSDTVWFRKCTSQLSGTRKRDIIEDYLEAGLDKMTFVDPELRSISRVRLIRRLGHLSDEDYQEIGV